MSDEQFSFSEEAVCLIASQPAFKVEDTISVNEIRNGLKQNHPLALYFKYYTGKVSINTYLRYTKSGVFDSSLKKDGRLGPITKWLLYDHISHGIHHLHDTDNYIALYKEYLKYNKYLKEKDIYKYSSILLRKEIGKMFLDGTIKLTKRDARNQYDVIFEDDEFLVTLPKNYETLNRFGKNSDGSPTEWCTNNRSVYMEYIMEGEIYQIRSKKKRFVAQFHFPTRQFRDASNGSVCNEVPLYIIEELLKHYFTNSKSITGFSIMADPGHQGSLHKVISIFSPEAQMCGYTTQIALDEIESIIKNTKVLNMLIVLLRRIKSRARHLFFERHKDARYDYNRIAELNQKTVSHAASSILSDIRVIDAMKINIDYIRCHLLSDIGSIERFIALSKHNAECRTLFEELIKRFHSNIECRYENDDLLVTYINGMPTQERLPPRTHEAYVSIIASLIFSEQFELFENFMYNKFGVKENSGFLALLIVAGNVNKGLGACLKYFDKSNKYSSLLYAFQIFYSTITGRYTLTAKQNKHIIDTFLGYAVITSSVSHFAMKRYAERFPDSFVAKCFKVIHRLILAILSGRIVWEQLDAKKHPQKECLLYHILSNRFDLSNSSWIRLAYLTKRKYSEIIYCNNFDSYGLTILSYEHAEWLRKQVEYATDLTFQEKCETLHDIYKTYFVEEKRKENFEAYLTALKTLNKQTNFISYANSEVSFNTGPIYTGPDYKYSVRFELKGS